MSYIDIATFITKIILAVLGLTVMYIGIPWVKNVGIPWLKEKHLYEQIKKFVRAAEKLGESGAIPKAEKNAYVIELLQEKGVSITPEVKALIESAVGDLDDMFSEFITSVLEEFDEEDNSTAE